MNQKIKYRLALDVGANSLGWCVYRLDDGDDPDKIIRLGSRIFSDGRDPKTLASHAADRRMARQARRRRDRLLKRRQSFMQALVEFGFMPSDEAQRKALEESDPYTLRARGLDEQLAPHELGRALYHLARKRGFRSSRKDARDEAGEKESGKVHAAIKALREQITEEGCRTVGEYLARRHEKREPVRGRPTLDGKSYVLYLQRAMVEEEFNKLWEVQKGYHPQLLTEKARETLRDIMLFQRRLKPVEPGRCLYEPDEYRTRLCAPLQQRFRMLQELNNLRVRDGIGNRALTLEERNKMLALLERDTGPRPVSFSKLAKAAGLANAKSFNFERDSKRNGLKGDGVGAHFSAVDALGDAWLKLSSSQQYALSVLVEQADQVDALKAALLALPEVSEAQEDILKSLYSKDECQAVTEALCSLPFKITAAQAEVLVKFRLPDDYGRLSLKALSRIVPELEKSVITYDKAVESAGYPSHSDFYTGEVFERLPYYGEILRGYTSPMPAAENDDERQYGKIPNPTVHIGLNQIRQLVNALIKRYGHPEQVVIELTREFGASADNRREIIKRQKDAQDRNERYDAELRDLGLRTNRVNRQKLQLWEELGDEDAMDRHCVYSGKHLSKTLLFSDEVEIDHILPFSRSLHDGIGNKILCTRQSNRDKRDQTPFEAWGHTDSWVGIVERAERLPEHKRKLFQENALETFLGDKNFLARHLNDTAYLGRATKQYLTGACPPSCIWVSTGKLTGMIRGKFGLSKLLSQSGAKNRADHRHHALDAAVIGLCDRSLIQRMSTAAARAEEQGENRLLEGLELPWPSFRDELKQSLDAVIVSHKPDHGKQAALHNDTNYGKRGEPDRRGSLLVGHRKLLMNIKSAKEAQSIASSALRKDITQLLQPLNAGKDVKAALEDYVRRTGIRRVLIEERLSVIPINDRKTHQPYRYVKGDSNYCYEIFRKPNGRWDGEVINTFSANQKAFAASLDKAQNGMSLVMRIHKDDILVIGQDELCRCMRVAQFTKGKVIMADVREANVDARNRDPNDPFKFMLKSPSALKVLCARAIGVDILGYANDPGFKE